LEYFLFQIYLLFCSAFENTNLCLTKYKLLDIVKTAHDSGCFNFDSILKIE